MIPRIPPQATEIESKVLGSVMIEKGIFDEVLHLLKTDYFYDPRHGLIFDACLSLYHSGKPIDMVTVNNELKRTGKLEDAGNSLYITELVSKTAIGENIPFYAAIIKQRAIQRKVAVLMASIYKDSFDDTIDVDDLLTNLNKQALELTEELYGQTVGLTFSELLADAMKQAEKRAALAKSNQISGLPTPIKQLSRTLNGFQPGDLIIMAGRPSMGKTALALNSALSAAEAGSAVCIFSLEMPAVKLADRFLIGASGVDADNYKSGYLSEGNWLSLEGTVNNLQNLKIYIDDNPIVNMDYIRSRSRIQQRKGNCDMIIIDYLGLISPDRVKGQNREQEVADISKRCKAMAREMNVPVLLLSQLNRSCESTADKRPNLSHLRESGAIEQDADVVILVYRPEFYGINEIDGHYTTGMGELNVAKHRNGKTGVVYFGYNESLTKITDYKQDYETKEIW